MTIEELNKIVECKNLDKISKAIIECGYRNGNKYAEWEFDLIAIANAENVERGESFEEIFDDKIYVGEIYTQVKEYPDTKFILITVKKIYRDRDNFEFPLAMSLFTDAPINEDYEKEQSKIAKCEICKREFTFSELCEVNGKLVCDECVEKDLKNYARTGKSKLTKVVKIKKKYV